MNNVGSKTLFNPVFISIASTWAFLRVYLTYRLFLQYYFPNYVHPNQSCQLSLWEETGAPGQNPRLSRERWQTLHMHESVARIEPTISERRLLWRLRHRSPRGVSLKTSTFCRYFSASCIAIRSCLVYSCKFPPVVQHWTNKKNSLELIELSSIKKLF
jgi:hypothetical protein